MSISSAGLPGVLIIPGLHDSGPDHWQSCLQRQHLTTSLRVVQDDWHAPNLGAWAQRIGATLASRPHRPWLAVAHSFGCLALAHWLHCTGNADGLVRAALLVAPADPDKFCVASQLRSGPLPVPCVVVASETDPWMRLDNATHWAGHWGCHLVNLGDAGHINTESGFGSLPLAQRWVATVRQRHVRGLRIDVDGATMDALAA